MDRKTITHSVSSSTSGAERPQFANTDRDFLWAIAFIFITIVILVLWTHFKLMWYDEFLELWTDSAPNVGKLLEIQLNHPISLDPLTYHFASHWTLQLLGGGAFAIRFPSMIGFLLMQVSLYVFVSRVADQRTAVIALAFPMLTSAFSYAVEGRPYGLMLGLFGLAMVAWQSAIRCETPRIPKLIGLALTIALTVNAHYFGFLLLVPFIFAEAYRCFERKRIDFPVAASIALGAASMIFVLPFLRGAGEFRVHSYLGMTLYPIQDLYIAVTPFGHFFEVYSHPTYETLFCVASALILLFCVLRAIRLRIPIAELIFLVVLAALPFVSYMVAKFATHTLAPRFTLGAAIGISSLLALGLSHQSGRWCRGNIALTILLLLVMSIGANHIWRAYVRGRRTLAALTLPSQVSSLLSGPLYYQDIHQYSVASYYEPDPKLRLRMVLLYSGQLELRWEGRDTDAITARHLLKIEPFPIQTFEEIASRSQGQLFLSFEDEPFDWTKQEFTTAGAEVKPIGDVLGGHLQLVRFGR